MSWHPRIWSALIGCARAHEEQLRTRVGRFHLILQTGLSGCATPNETARYSQCCSLVDSLPAAIAAAHCRRSTWPNLYCRSCRRIPSWPRGVEEAAERASARTSRMSARLLHVHEAAGFASMSSVRTLSFSVLQKRTKRKTSRRRMWVAANASQRRAHSSLWLAPSSNFGASLSYTYATIPSCRRQRPRRSPSAARFGWRARRDADEDVRERAGLTQLVVSFQWACAASCCCCCPKAFLAAWLKCALIAIHTYSLVVRPSSDAARSSTGVSTMNENKSISENSTIEKLPNLKLCEYTDLYTVSEPSGWRTRGARSGSRRSRRTRRWSTPSAGLHTSPRSGGESTTEFPYTIWTLRPWGRPYSSTPLAAVTEYSVIVQHYCIVLMKARILIKVQVLHVNFVHK